MEKVNQSKIQINSKSDFEFRTDNPKIHEKMRAESDKKYCGHN